MDGVAGGGWLPRAWAAAMFAGAALALWIAFADLPRERAHGALNPLKAGEIPPREELDRAADLLAAARARAPWRGEVHIDAGRVALARLTTLDPSEVPEAARDAYAMFAEGLARKPNARGGWRGLMAAALLGLGPGEEVRKAVEAALLLDPGDAFTALTALEIVLRYPGLFDEETRELAYRAIPRAETTWNVRRAFARLYVSLDEAAQAEVVSRLEDPERFIRWAEHVAG